MQLSSSVFNQTNTDNAIIPSILPIPSAFRSDLCFYFRFSVTFRSPPKRKHPRIGNLKKKSRQQKLNEKTEHLLDFLHALRHAIITGQHSHPRPQRRQRGTYKSKNANWLGLLPNSYTNRLAR